ncbi:hypothetical protein FI667_g5694, partial [Globisporangium splendens]
MEIKNSGSSTSNTKSGSCISIPSIGVCSERPQHPPVMDDEAEALQESNDAKRTRAMKRQADAFRAFSAWRSKVRIVKRMRKMFLFQDSFCLENHFGAWKRFSNLKKHQMARFQKATEFMNNSRITKCWMLWTRWISLKRQENETIQRAIGFRQRFFSWKCFTHWKAEISWRKRKKQVAALASQHVKARCLERALHGLIQMYSAKKKLLQRQRQAERFIANMRLTRVLERLQVCRTKGRNGELKRQKPRCTSMRSTCGNTGISSGSEMLRSRSRKASGVELIDLGMERLCGRAFEV